MADALPPTEPRPARKRRHPAAQVGLAVVGLVSVGLTCASSVQIIKAALFPPVAASEDTCAQGVGALYHSIERARQRAAAELDGERAALRDFRVSLEPEWSNYGTIQARCLQDHDPRGRAALRSVELLRYAEERAVRYDALDLSRLRRMTPQALEALSSPAASK